MCGGISFEGQKSYFPQPEARLPVMLKLGGVTWVVWGRRERNLGRFPSGGWARLNSIRAGKWKPWHPRPVIIRADQFLEKDHEGKSHWIDVAPNMAIQGLLAERDDQQRVYVVTEETPPEFHWIHDRWPRLVKYMG